MLHDAVEIAKLLNFSLEMVGQELRKCELDNKFQEQPKAVRSLLAKLRHQIKDEMKYES